ncbi:helix-turn-helix domain-containing protein [Streptosporangium minutum]|nr:ATP-binding protein [Streptosporangium minutum]
MEVNASTGASWREAIIHLTTQSAALWTMNDIEFEMSSDQAPSISLATLRNGIFEYRRLLPPIDPSGNPNKSVNREVNLCIDDMMPLPWEEGPMIFVDFTLGDEFDFDLSVRSNKEIPLRVVASRVESILEEYGCRLRRTKSTEEPYGIRMSHDPGSYVWTVQGVCPSSVTVSQICTIRKELNYSTFFFNQSFTDPRTVYELVRTGSIARLLGLAENEWLEVKSSPYEMKRDKQWQCELAEDVARFANSEYGGILILGIRSEKAEGRDVLRKITPLPLDGKRVQNYHQSLDSHIHPPIERIKIESIKTEGGEILCILIPPQPEERKPFLVQGGFVDGKYQRGLISIVRRRGEHSIPITAREIHAMLVAGRALLRAEGRRAPSAEESSQALGDDAL